MPNQSPRNRDPGAFTRPLVGTVAHGVEAFYSLSLKAHLQQSVPPHTSQQQRAEPAPTHKPKAAADNLQGTQQPHGSYVIEEDLVYLHGAATLPTALP